jgi:hypothetical protein
VQIFVKNRFVTKSHVFFTAPLFIKRRKGLRQRRRQRQGDIMSVGGDMMALSHVRPKYNNLIEKMVKGNTTINSSLFAMWT